MVSKNIIVPFKMLPSILVLLLVLLLSDFAKCDLEKDRQQCTNQLVGLATCLPYVSGESRAPPIDCCTGFKQTMKTSPECMCLLIKDRNDPNLGLKINVTLAFSLPDRCNAHERNITECPALLHLPPNSTDAKVFEDFGNTANKNNTTTTTPTAGRASATSDDHNSDGGKGKTCLEIGTISGLLITTLGVHIMFNSYSIFI